MSDITVIILGDSGIINIIYYYMAQVVRTLWLVNLPVRNWHVFSSAEYAT